MGLCLGTQARVQCLAVSCLKVFGSQVEQKFSDCASFSPALAHTHSCPDFYNDKDT